MDDKLGDCSPEGVIIGHKTNDGNMQQEIIIMCGPLETQRGDKEFSYCCCNQALDWQPFVAKNLKKAGRIDHLKLIPLKQSLTSTRPVQCFVWAAFQCTMDVAAGDVLCNKQQQHQAAIENMSNADLFKSFGEGKLTLNTADIFLVS